MSSHSQVTRALPSSAEWFLTCSVHGMALLSFILLQAALSPSALHSLFPGSVQLG